MPWPRAPDADDPDAVGIEDPQAIRAAVKHVVCDLGPVGATRTGRPHR